ncbi:MAG: hypothetical protein PHQ67_02075 [Fermentimonas sp.]|jgi:hypothetical protein|nr:hypothetical protein [Fermentimonas sp.]MDD4008580.1 hypothetical protein [Fermentimonas sp.]MDD4696778.1 hypothetical protein [Fermentimonas sp.]
MEKYDTYNEEEAIRKMLKSSKIEAPENLKYRIMHQIETEKAFTSQKINEQVSTKKASGNVLKDLTSIFGTMYGVLAVIIAVAYFVRGEEFLLSLQFWGSIVFTASIFSLLWLISRLDANLREKRSTSNLNQKNNSEQ